MQPRPHRTFVLLPHTVVPFDGDKEGLKIAAFEEEFKATNPDMAARKATSFIGKYHTQGDLTVTFSLQEVPTSHYQSGDVFNYVWERKLLEEPQVIHAPEGDKILRYSNSVKKVFYDEDE